MAANNEVSFCGEHTKLVSQISRIETKVDTILTWVEEKKKDEKNEQNENKNDKRFNITTLIAITGVAIALVSLMR